jgi:hypothetical protein
MSRMLQGKTKCFQQAQLASGCSTRHTCDTEQAILTAPEPPRSRDEIISDIVLELAGARGKSLILPENDVRAELSSLVSRLIAGARKWSRDYRKAEVGRARAIDDLLTELEVALADPLAPRFNKQIIFEMLWVHAVIREACQKQMELQPKGRREVDHIKRLCASSALHLVQRFSRHPISGSAESTFSVIAALVYEAVTGERDSNVKRAAEHVLRERRD